MIRIKNTLGLARLPSEYQEVEYIQSTGTQYIDTGVINSTSGVGCEIKFQLTTIAETQHLIGELSASKSRFAPLYIDTEYTEFLYSNALSYNPLSFGVTKDTNIHILSFNAENTDIIFDGAKKGTAQKVNVSNGGTVYLFKRNYSSEVTPIPAYAKLYYCKLYDANTLVRNLIPCYRKSDNEAGLYDLVNNVFYTNAGSGTFLMGNEVHKRDINIDPVIGDKPLLRRYVQGKLVYGEEPVKYEQLVNYTMLYDRGDECSEITGGYDSNVGLGSNYRAGNVTFETNHIAMSGTSKGTNASIDNVMSTISSKNMIDLTPYTVAGIVWECSRSTTSSYNGIFFDTERGYVPSDSRDVVVLGNTFNTKSIINVDINTSNSLYFNIFVSAVSITTYNAKLYNAFLMKEDDWQTLATKAGITASSIDNILTNSTTLLNNEDAVEFMIYQCTGSFMASAVANATFLTALNNSPYYTKIQANEHWNKFLSMVA